MQPTCVQRGRGKVQIHIANECKRELINDMHRRICKYKTQLDGLESEASKILEDNWMTTVKNAITTTSNTSRSKKRERLTKKFNALKQMSTLNRSRT